MGFVSGEQFKLKINSHQKSRYTASRDKQLVDLINHKYFLLRKKMKANFYKLMIDLIFYIQTLKQLKLIFIYQLVINFTMDSNTIPFPNKRQRGRPRKNKDQELTQKAFAKKPATQKDKDQLQPSQLDKVRQMINNEKIGKIGEDPKNRLQIMLLEKKLFEKMNKSYDIQDNSFEGQQNLQETSFFLYKTEKKVDKQSVERLKKLVKMLQQMKNQGKKLPWCDVHSVQAKQNQAMKEKAQKIVTRAQLQIFASGLLNKRQFNLFVMRIIQQKFFDRYRRAKEDNQKSKVRPQNYSNHDNLQFKVKRKFFSEQLKNQKQQENQYTKVVNQNYQWLLNQFTQMVELLDQYFEQTYIQKLSMSCWLYSFLQGQLYESYQYQVQELQNQDYFTKNYSYRVLPRLIFFLCIHLQLKDLIRKPEQQKLYEQQKEYQIFQTSTLESSPLQLEFYCQNILSKLCFDNIITIEDSSQIVDHRNIRRQKTLIMQIMREKNSYILNQFDKLCWKQQDANIKFKFILDLLRLLKKLVDNGIGLEFSRENITQKNSSLIVTLKKPFKITKSLKQIQKVNPFLHQILQYIVNNFFQIMLKQNKSQSAEKCPNAQLFRKITRKFASIYPQNLEEKDYNNHFSLIQNNIQFAVQLIHKLFDQSNQALSQTEKLSAKIKQDVQDVSFDKIEFQKKSVYEIARDINSLQNQLNQVSKQQNNKELMQQRFELDERHKLIQSYLKLKIDQITFKFYKAFYKKTSYSQFKFIMTTSYYNQSSTIDNTKPKEQIFESPIYTSLSRPELSIFSDLFNEHKDYFSGVIGYQIQVDSNPKLIKLEREEKRQGKQYILHGRQIGSAKRTITNLLFPEKQLQKALDDHIKEYKKDKGQMESQKLQYSVKSQKFVKQRQIIAKSTLIFTAIIFRAIGGLKFHLPLLAIQHLVMLVTKDRYKQNPNLKQIFAVPKIDVIKAIIDESKANRLTQEHSYEEYYLRKLIKSLDLELKEHNLLICTILVLSTITKLSYKKFISTINDCLLKNTGGKKLARKVYNEFVIKKQRQNQNDIIDKQFQDNIDHFMMAVQEGIPQNFVIINPEDLPRAQQITRCCVFRQYSDKVYPFRLQQIRYQTKVYRYNGRQAGQLNLQQRMQILMLRSLYHNAAYLINTNTGQESLGIITDVLDLGQRQRHFAVTTLNLNEAIYTQNTFHPNVLVDLNLIQGQIRAKKLLFSNIQVQLHNGMLTQKAGFILRLFQILERANSYLGSELLDLNMAKLKIAEKQVQNRQSNALHLVPFFNDYYEMRRFINNQFQQQLYDINLQAITAKANYIASVPFQLRQYGRIRRQQHYEKQYCIFNYPLYYNTFLDSIRQNNLNEIKFKLDIGNLGLIICQFLHESSLNEPRMFIDEYQKLVRRHWDQKLIFDLNQNPLTQEQRNRKEYLEQNLSNLQDTFDNQVYQLITKCHPPFGQGLNIKFAKLLAMMMKVNLKKRIKLKDLLGQVAKLKQDMNHP